MKSHLTDGSSMDNQLSDSIITAEAIYQTLIRQTPNLYPLCKFKTNKGSNKQLFPDALKYPDFFNYNLVSPGRVIKKLQGVQSVIRGFYYQLMKLAFQIQIQGKDYIEVMKNLIFSPEFMLEENPSSPSSGNNYSDLQYKKIVAEFMEILMNQTIPNFQLTILSYPILDEAMVKILENLLKFKSSLEINVSLNIQILQQLSQLFEVTMVDYGNCFKFQQSDIFLYQHSPSQFYIAFLNEMAEMSDVSQSSRRKQSNQEKSSQKKILNDDQEDNEYEFSERKQRKTRDNLHSQFQIQSPPKQVQRYCSSDLTENKHHSDTKIDKNYRNTYGFNEIKTYQQVSIYPEQRGLEAKVNQPRRQNRQSIINKLYNLVDSTENAKNNNLHNYGSQEPYNQQNEINLPDSKLVSSISNPTPIFTELEAMRPKLASQFELKKNIHTNIDTNDPKNIPSQYQYQTKKYHHNFPQEQSRKFMIQSTQSDEVIGYSDFNQGKVINSREKKNNPNHQKPCEIKKHDNFTGIIRESPYINIAINTPNGTKNQQKYANQFESKLKQTQNLFYSPKTIFNKHSYLQPSNLQAAPEKHKHSEDETLGTLYRQFSDTKVLDILPEQVQYNIRRMRRKFKGIHSKDLYGFK